MVGWRNNSSFKEAVAKPTRTIPPEGKKEKEEKKSIL